MWNSILYIPLTCVPCSLAQLQPSAKRVHMYTYFSFTFILTSCGWWEKGTEGEAQKSGGRGRKGGARQAKFFPPFFFFKLFSRGKITKVFSAFWPALGSCFFAFVNINLEKTHKAVIQQEQNHFSFYLCFYRLILLTDFLSWFFLHISINF